MNDILVILMVAFGLFTIVMFVLFYVYLKKYYNRKHQEDDYEKIGEEDNDNDDVPFDENINEPIEPVLKSDMNPSSLDVNNDYESEFVPIKKK